MEILDHILEEDLIKEIQNGGRSLFRMYYLKERKIYIDWATHRFGISEKKASRLYHKSFLKLYETLSCQKIDKTQLSLNQILYSITKFLVHEDPELKMDLTDDLNEEEDLPENIRELLFKTNGSEEKPEIKLKAVWDSLDQKSKMAVRMLYFDNLEPGKVAENLGLENEEEVMILKEASFTKFFKVL